MIERTLTSDTPTQIDKEVTLYGWVHSKRNMGQIVFVDLRDGFGLVQVVFADNPGLQAQAEELRPEFVVKIVGTVVKRGAKQVNDKLPTGSVEVQAHALEVINEAQTPPFEIDRENVEDEELRLKYRYLDIRHERLHKNLLARHQTITTIREFLNNQGFIDIETPILSAPTPEGARDFLVPSRKYPGSFYALPQAPQQYKQLLMVAGMERYYQIAKCLRDEDSRGDRQPEFTQLDLEMAFADRETIMQLNEDLLIKIVKDNYPDKTIQTTPFPRLSYREAMDKYGTDRPDLRTDKSDPNLLAFVWITDFPFFEETDTGQWTFTHNPFSAVTDASQADLLAQRNIDQIISQQYDVVLNGFEIGGGSIRNHQPTSLLAALKIMGYDQAAAEKSFGHMLEAFTYGAPPHGGIAWGLDRLVMVLQNEPNIREVMAFPKTDKFRDPMMDSPQAADPKILKELGLQTITKSKT